MSTVSDDGPTTENPVDAALASVDLREVLDTDTGATFEFAAARLLLGRDRRAAHECWLPADEPRRTVPVVASAKQLGRVRTAEVIAALSLATDLGTRAPLEQGLQSTLFGMRLAHRLGVDEKTASHTFYACLLFYVGCTAGAETAAEIFGDEQALTTYGAPARFGSRKEMMAGLLRAIAPADLPAPVRGSLSPSALTWSGESHAQRVASPHRSAIGPSSGLTSRMGVPSIASRPST